MNSIVTQGLEVKKKKISNNIFKVLLSLIFTALILLMSSDPLNFGFVEEAEAASLTSVSVVPASGIIDQRTTYDIFLRTATSGAIKTIEMTFPSSFNLAAATKLIESEGIGSGSLSTSGSTLKYTVSSPVSVSAGTSIRLEIARLVANNAGSFTVSIRTLDTANSQIDGPTNSASFVIKSVFGQDVSKSFMIRKTLNDDDAGHAHGWDPNGSTKSFAIFDNDISGASDNEFISVMIRYANLAYCTSSPGDTGLFVVHCNSAPVDSAVLDYVITKLPANVVTSTDTSVFTSSSALLSTSSQDIASFARHDDIASEFP